MAYSFVYDGGHLIAPASGGGKVEWEFTNSFNTYKTVRPGGMYRYAIIVEANYDRDFYGFDSLAKKPDDYVWTGDVNIIPAYEEYPFSYYTADTEFMESEWAQTLKEWFWNREAVF